VGKLIIATFGSKVFEVSNNRINTINDLSLSYGLEVENQDQDGNKPSTYIKGYKLMEFSFKVKLDSIFVDVNKELADWQFICNQKIPYYFILGGNSLSVNKFLLVDVGVSDTVIDGFGTIIKCSIDLKLQEYVRPGYKEYKDDQQAQKAAAKKAKKSGGVDYKQVVNDAMKRYNQNATNAISSGEEEEEEVDE
jgi:hypothetical protein